MAGSRITEPSSIYLQAVSPRCQSIPQSGKGSQGAKSLREVFCRLTRRTSMQGTSEAYLELFFCLAQRFFCASEIRLLASALMWRRLRGCEPAEVTDAADVLFRDRPLSRAAIALSMRSLSSFNSPIIRSV